MYTIRNYASFDKKAVESICLTESTGNLDMDEAILTTFCYYYIDNEPDNCLVVVNSLNKSVGYIFCAADYCKWRARFYELYLNDSANPITRTMSESTMNALAPFANEYPAHLHIELLPECQGQHLGSQLIQELIAHLKSKGISGLMLDVAKNNTHAQYFYHQNGFHILSSSEQECTMGIHIKEVSHE